MRLARTGDLEHAGIEGSVDAIVVHHSGSGEAEVEVLFPVMGVDADAGSGREPIDDQPGQGAARMAFGEDRAGAHDSITSAGRLGFRYGQLVRVDDHDPMLQDFGRGVNPEDFCNQNGPGHANKVHETVVMPSIIQGAGIFFWLLLPCSIIAVFIFVERLIALRRTAVIPEATVKALLDGKEPPHDDTSVLARISRFARDHAHDESATLAYARLEVNRMERGFVFLEFIVGAAPMIGLMGTVTALMRVFGALDPATGSVVQVQLTQGISLALSTTFLGLLIAVPSLFFISYLQRRVESHAAQIESLLERVQSVEEDPEAKP